MEGQGAVSVIQQDNRLIFSEKGIWKNNQVSFYNSLRWTLEDNAIALEHLRYGANRPTFLFHVIPNSPQSLSSSQVHVCTPDVYAGKVILNSSGFSLNWQVQGSRKNHLIRYVYD